MNMHHLGSGIVVLTTYTAVEHYTKSNDDCHGHEGIQAFVCASAVYFLDGIPQ